MYSEKKILFGQKYPAKNYLGITEGENKMKDEKISNYVKLCEDWADKFMKMDLENLRKRVPELKEEKGFFTLVRFRAKIRNQPEKWKDLQYGWPAGTRYNGNAEYLYTSWICKRRSFFYE